MGASSSHHRFIEIRADNWGIFQIYGNERRRDGTLWHPAGSSYGCLDKRFAGAASAIEGLEDEILRISLNLSLRIHLFPWNQLWIPSKPPAATPIRNISRSQSLIPVLPIASASSRLGLYSHPSATLSAHPTPLRTSARPAMSAALSAPQVSLPSIEEMFPGTSLTRHRVTTRPQLWRRAQNVSSVSQRDQHTPRNLHRMRDVSPLAHVPRLDRWYAP